MRRWLTMIVLVVALAVPAGAAANEFETLVLVGAGGSSAEIRPRAGVLDSFFDRAHPLNRGGDAMAAVRPRGRFVLVYALTPAGLPGVPGRFYPDSRAACFDWSQVGPHPLCTRPNASLVRLQDGGRRLPRLDGDPTVVSDLRHGGRRLALPNLDVALTMAFGRSLAARPASRPRSCIALTARWRGASGRRPRSFCLGREGAWAGGRLYPLRGGVWSFARSNIRA
jgi:hypothetical protein